MPEGLAFTPGVMLFVIASGIIPETKREEAKRSITAARIAGFAPMLALDRLLG